ncbi:MAG: mechanosensitive ion channel family protein [Acidimicrobiaceae bacterium]|nr:mechanosensitive ion channel family protein [Acidimicrobiaceae bacterium]
MTWLWNHTIPAVLYVLGSLILVRMTRWFAERYQSGLDEEARRVIEAGGVLGEGSKRARALAQAIEWAIASLVYFIGGILALRQLGIPLTSLVAPATVAGVAIGFGAQQLVGDLLAGFFLFAEHQFGVGDLIRLSMPGQLTGITGTVEELTLRVTKLRSTQGELIVVPNSALRQVTNLSRDWSRVVLDIPIPVDEDLQRAIQIITDSAKAMAAEQVWSSVILGDPTMAGVQTIEVGYVQLRLLVRTLPGRQFDVSRELQLRVVLALRRAGIRTPGAATSAETGIAS